jgi:hypothetical protein
VRRQEYEGPRAGRLIRTLVDVAPPYRVSELAEATRLTAGYVSRLLDALDVDALVERGARGRVVHVDIRGLLKRWAESYDVFATNDTATYVASRGALHALTQFAELSDDSGRIVVTGSFAAARSAPVAAPGLLCAYCEDPRSVADGLALLPTDQGANVALLAPSDPVVWDRTTVSGGVRYAAPAQAVVDCLTGNGRMPAEGEALLEWMLADEDAWRLSTLAEPRAR